MVGGWRWDCIGNERIEMNGMGEGWIGRIGDGGRMRMLKYFVDKYPIKICRMV